MNASICMTHKFIGPSVIYTSNQWRSYLINIKKSVKIIEIPYAVCPAERKLLLQAPIYKVRTLLKDLWLCSDDISTIELQRIRSTAEWEQEDE